MTISTQVERWATFIRRAIPETQNIEQAALQAKRDFEDMAGPLNSQQEKDFLEAELLVKKEFEQVEILRVGSIIRKRPKWYTGLRTSDKHWPSLLQYVKNVKKWDKDTTDSMHSSSSEVVSLLENPIQPKFSCRGLVIGYVQSGKTANMTAVIAKAVDAGYNTIIVLAGLTDKLRQQTQNRLKLDIIDRHPLYWQSLTSNDLKGDFAGLANGGFGVPSEGRAQLAVVKKNVGPLKKLAYTFQKTIPAAMNRLKVLIIDDECDQATVNSASKELEITVINAWIRTILAQLPAVSYVGYTATPFANVLINPYGKESVDLEDSPLDNKVLDDLYPSDFITCLPKPTNYFGAEQLFGKPSNNADIDEPENDGLDMIREVPLADERLLQPDSSKKKDSFQPKIPESLQDAILYFIACCAVRNARGDNAKHSTMLIHTSTFVILHERLGTLIQGWIEKHRDNLSENTGAITEQLMKVWNREKDKIPTTITSAKKIELTEILENISGVLKNLETPIENGSSQDRIDYSGNKKTYIVVGGSILARGLTLEGLVVSYFLRSSTKQYDTLLQMGRWFGYRPNYEDLPRIWMPSSLKLSFRALAGIEAEVRSEILQYKETERGPMEFAVRIRSLPGMAITSANKMKSAVKCDLSYSGKHIQSIRFDHLNKTVIDNNWQAAADLVSRAHDLGDPTNTDKKLFLNVPKSVVIQFLSKYKFHSSHRDLSDELLLNYIENEKSGLKKWNIGIFETASEAQSTLPLGTLGHVKLVKRTKLKGDSDYADIKGLMSLSDILFDLDPRPNIKSDDNWSTLKELRSNAHGNVPLLLLYAIDKDSKPAPNLNLTSKRVSQRVELAATGDLIGVGIVFPGSSEGVGSFVSVSLQSVSADQIDEIEEEELEQAEAAGVH
ncbi:Z1 domain-containing protein [Pseudomonas fluorescens]|uniref:Z1 domain-containing protein n=1 Tax=Pseudomonas fluorescens TaxID=294 RepID=UPI002ACA3119|nr:Z1 domain-containing protein [Pseudomonas fluorescens]MDZ5435398.1 Z1 domain-containing protein [Pseudomonas fluorescens]